MRRIHSVIVLVLSAFAGPVQAQEEWRPVEQTTYYPVAGESGIALYRSIGERGPLIGHERRTIAHTNFKLTWTRKYQPQPDGSCRISIARPKLVITYTLPKPVPDLTGGLQRKWDVFIAGLREHEQQHGMIILDMVKEIERVSLSLVVAEDRGCRKIRPILQEKLGEISRRERQRNADFDKVEMSDGGTVQKLILQLVNGD